MSKAEIVFEKLALNMRLSHLKPVFKYMKQNDIKLVRSKKGMPQILTEYKAHKKGFDMMGSTVKINKIDKVTLNYPKTNSQVLKYVQKVIPVSKHKVTAYMGHELGHHKQIKDLIGVDLSKINTPAAVRVKAENSLFSGILGKMSEGKDLIALERDASQVGVKILKDLKIPVKESKANKILTRALASYQLSGGELGKGVMSLVRTENFFK